MESETLDSDTADRPRGILSEADRKYLLATEQEREDSYSRQAQNLRQREITSRLRNAVRDFRILNEELASELRDRIFDVPPHSESDARAELDADIAHLLQFLYVSMGGQVWFDRPLQRAVANGEKELGHVDHALMVNPTFDVTVRRSEDLDKLAADALDKLDDGKRLMELDGAEVIAVARYIDLGGGIDTDHVRDMIELHRDALNKNTDTEDGTD
jgi:hypothetical protein